MQSLDRQRQTLALATSALAGFVDAVGFVAAGGYFLSFMSGNTTRLGVNLASDLHMAVVPAALIAGFVLGVVLGALVAERGAARRKTAVLALCSVLLIVAALLYHPWRSGFLGASVMAMGALNNVFRRNGEVVLGVTYMTGALVKLGQGIAAVLMRQPATGRLGAGWLWLALAVGAISGAATFSTWPATAPWVAAAACITLLGGAWLIEGKNVPPAG